MSKYAALHRISKICARPGCGVNFGILVSPSRAEKQIFCSRECHNIASSADAGTPGRIQRMKEMRAKNISIIDIAIAEGITKQRVQQQLGKTGHLAVRTIRDPEILKRYDWIKAELEKNPRASQVARRLGVHYDVVRNAAKFHGIKLIAQEHPNRELKKKGMWKCSGPCRKIKKFSEYPNDSTRKSGKAPRCIECNRKLAKSYYWTHVAKNRSKA